MRTLKKFEQHLMESTNCSNIVYSTTSIYGEYIVLSEESIFIGKNNGKNIMRMDRDNIATIENKYKALRKFDKVPTLKRVIPRVLLLILGGLLYKNGKQKSGVANILVGLSVLGVTFNSNTIILHDTFPDREPIQVTLTEAESKNLVQNLR